MIGGGQDRTFKLHLIYPKKKESEQPGKVYDAPAGTGRGNYAHTGNWVLSKPERDLLESRIRRSLGESGVKIEPGMTIYNSQQEVDEFRTNWGPPVADLGIGNHQYSDNIVPIYLIRGFGAYAGGQPGKNFTNSYFVIGDSVIESLAGFKGINGQRAYEIIKDYEGEPDVEFHGTYQAQMGTVLHEGFHAVAALPHRDGVWDYAENYAGAHGEEFAKAIDDTMRGRAGTDKFAAMNLIMNEPWNYGWGTVDPTLQKEISSDIALESAPAQLPEDVPRLSTTPTPLPTATPKTTTGPRDESMTWEQILQKFIDSVGTAKGPGVTRDEYEILIGRNVPYETALRIVQKYSEPTGTLMSEAYGGLTGTQKDRPFTSSEAKKEPTGATVTIAGLGDASVQDIIFGGGNQGIEGGQVPLNWFTSEALAIAAADIEYPYGDPVPGMPYSYDIIQKGYYFTYVDAKVPTPADKRWSLVVNPEDGNTYRVDQSDPKPPTEEDLVFKAAIDPPAGAEAIGIPIPLGNGKSLQVYSITDGYGNTSTTNVVLEADDPRVLGSAIELDEGKGDLVYLGDGRYEHVPDIEAPFQHVAGDVIELPDQGGSLIKTSENQYQFVRDTYDPGVKEHTDDQGNVRQFTQSASGTWTELGPRAKPGVVPFGGRDFLQQPTGALSELAPRFDPGVIESGGREFAQQLTGEISELDPRFDVGLQQVDGMSLLQQRTGDVGQLTPPNLDQIITQALVDLDFDKAFAFQDFRDRPTAQEAFQTALEFARSPADQRIISAIARGITPVQPPPEGTIQRVGPQPDFLIKAYQDVQRRTQAGRAPTPEEAQALTDRAAAGKTPVTDTLQMRLEQMSAKMDQDAEVHQVKLQGIIDKGQREAEKWRVLFDQQVEKNNRENTVVPPPAPPPAGAAAGAAAALPAGAAAALPAGTPDTVVPPPSDERALLLAQEKEKRDLIKAERRADAEERAAKLLAAIEAGFNPAQYNMMGGPAVEAHQAFLADEQRTAGRAKISKILEEDPDLGRTGGMAPMPSTTPGADLIPSQLTWGPKGMTFADVEYAVGLGSKLPSDLKTGRAGGGVVQPGEVTVVGEAGPEIAMMPPGTHILPLGKATKRDIRAAQSTGRAYQTGGIVFDDLPPGLQQLWRGRPITPPRGYLLQQGGLPLPSPQALQNLAPGTRESFVKMAGDIGISPAEFRQELQQATPRGVRFPTSRMLPLGRRGVR